LERANAHPLQTRTVVTGIAVLAASAAALAVVAFVRHGPPTAREWLVGLMFFGLLTLGAMPAIRRTLGHQPETVDLFEVVLVPAIWALPGFLLIPLVGLTVVIANVVRRNDPIRSVFNAAQLAASVGLAALVFDAIRAGERLSARNTFALILAMVIELLLNEMAVGWVLHTAEGVPFRSAIVRPIEGSVGGLFATDALNILVGLLLVTAYRWSVASVPFFAVPLLVAREAYRRHMATVVLQHRLEAVRRAAHEIGSTQDIGDAIAGFLVEVRDCFDAGGVELAVQQKDATTIHRLAGHDGHPHASSVRYQRGTFVQTLIEHGRALVADRDHPQVGALLVDGGWDNAIAVPLRYQGRTTGLLAVYDRGGQIRDEDDLSVLEALGAEVTVVIMRGILEQEVRRERRRLGELVNYTRDAGLALDEHGIVLMWNAGLERITSYPAEQIVGTSLPGPLDPTDPAGRPVRMEAWADGEALPNELILRTRTGQARWLFVSYTRLPATASNPAMLVVVGRDVTAQRETEQMREAFAGTVAHELRAPLSPILGWAGTLVDHYDNLTRSQRLDIVSRIRDQAEHLERLISKLLEVSTSQTGRTRRRATIPDVVALVRKVLDGERDEEPERMIVLREPSRPVRARGDEIWVEQILTNLLSNARKYSPEGSAIEIDVREDDNEVAIAVTDHGPGIPDDQLERIFEPFRRAPGSDGVEGTGLGLYVSRQLARALGGALTVQSRPGQGATFTLLISAHQRSHVPDRKPSSLGA